MSSAFSIALSSLQAESDAINTAGHNLANINTTGFKGSNVDFRDLVAASAGSGASFGMGVSSPINQKIFSQGAITSSTSPWAAAIQGNGFFVLKDSSGRDLYTRDGDFTLSSTGVLQTLGGDNVQGWMSSNDVLNTGVSPTDIILPTGQSTAPAQTANLSFTANLNAAGSASAGTNTLAVPVTVVDSLGYAHVLTVNFTKSSSTANTWTYDVTIPGAELAGGRSGTQTSILTSPGTLTFNSDGTLSSASSSAVTLNISNLADGASNLSVNWNLTNASGSPLLTQYAETSSYDAVTQDGSAGGQLNSVTIGDGGQLLASFSNGQTKVVGQLALATFRNTDSLQAVGSNNFATTGTTAPAAIGIPQTGGRGQIVSSSLEGSNVDIGTQFTNLITYQRGYQASSKVITTEDNILQNLLDLIR